LLLSALLVAEKTITLPKTKGGTRKNLLLTNFVNFVGSILNIKKLKFKSD